MNIDKFVDELSELWNDVTPNEAREITMWTGKGGAINAREMILGRELTQEEKDIYEDGVYEIGGKGGFIEYKGMQDSKHEDGYFVVNRGERGWYAEWWKNGVRQDFRRITEEEAQEFINSK